MLGSQVLEIAMGLFFLYLFFSVICSALNESVAWILGLRARNLRHCISRLFEGAGANGIADDIYRHPVVSGVTLGSHRPSYISAQAFSVALMDIAVKKANMAGTASRCNSHSLAQLRTAAASLAETTKLDDGTRRLGKVLVCLLDEPVSTVKEARESVEQWFNEAMETASRFYKRKTYGIVLAIAASMTLGLNVDTVRITKAFWTNAKLSAALAAQAEAVRQSNPGGGAPESAKPLNQGLSQVQALELPMGWHSWADFREGIIRGSTLVGLLLTIVAVSLGAPFWFDALNKVGNLRASGKPPESKLPTKPSAVVVEGLPE